MSQILSFEVYPKDENSLKNFQGYSVLCASRYLVEIKNFKESYIEFCRSVFVKEKIQTMISQGNQSLPLKNSYEWVVRVGFLAGVTDNIAKASQEALCLVPELKNRIGQVSSEKLFFINNVDSKDRLIKMVEEEFFNPLIEQMQISSFLDFKSKNRFLGARIPSVVLKPSKVENISLDKTDDELENFSNHRHLALSVNELKVIRDHFNKKEVISHRKKNGLPKNLTDVELEIFAQTWSEHCKHKIFSANIDYEEDNVPKDSPRLEKKYIKGLFPTLIKGTTDDIIARGLNWKTISLFSDNAGIVRFSELGVDLALKVETHNSPSVLDPYGGALTGILGVNRDILGCGLGAKPIANLDVFCVADEKSLALKEVSLPKGLKNPSKILSGVHKGVQDGGNKSGIPTVTGAIHFDDDFSGKPLIFCGTLGTLPQKFSHDLLPSKKYHKPKDNIVMIGGAIGIDGIHGATFSSLELGDNIPSTAVQIGAPLVQRRVWDFLMEAQKKGLYTAITDNGAGGLSSSVGEMAQQTGGADIDLKLACVKYPGLSPAQLIISESQERMSIAVSENHLKEFMNLADKYSVLCGCLGKFNDSGYFTIRYDGKKVGEIDINFLHEGLPQMDLKASWQGPLPRQYWHNKNATMIKTSCVEDYLIHLLSHPNISSKRYWVEQYDQGVQGSTLLRPFVGTHDGPSDSAVIWLGGVHGGKKKSAVTLSVGLCPQFSHIDPYWMAVYAVDEAIRNSVSSGGDPTEVAVLDNFCWPDPVLTKKNPDGSHKLGQLVRSVYGLSDACFKFKAPMISGKDSMKNDFIFEQKGIFKKISVPPTLLVTAVSPIKNVSDITTSPFKKSGDVIYLLGHGDYSKPYAGLFCDLFKSQEVLDLYPLNIEKSYLLYKAIHKLIQNKLINSCHDLSEGGLLCAVSESCIGLEMGAEIETNLEKDNLEHFLFGEIPSRFVISVNKDKSHLLEGILPKSSFMQIGRVTSKKSLKVKNKSESFSWEIKNLSSVWQGGASG